jgi:ATP-dependent DNA helicase RecG
MQAVPVQSKVFPDSVFIFNVGKLPDSWTVETLFEKHVSMPHNPNVASAIFRTGMVEAWGRGIEKMVDGCELIGAPNPIFKETGSDMSLEFLAPEDAVLKQGVIGQTSVNTDKIPINTDKIPIEDRERVIIEFITAHGGIKNKDARTILNLSDSTTKKLFEKMTANNTIKPIGDRGQRVYVLP